MQSLGQQPVRTSTYRLLSFQNASKEFGTACYKFAKRDLAACGETLDETQEISKKQYKPSSRQLIMSSVVVSRPKRFSDSAQEIANQVTDELDQMEQKNEVSGYRAFGCL